MSFRGDVGGVDTTLLFDSSSCRSFMVYFPSLLCDCNLAIYRGGFCLAFQFSSCLFCWTSCLICWTFESCITILNLFPHRGPVDPSSLDITPSGDAVIWISFLTDAWSLNVDVECWSLIVDRRCRRYRFIGIPYLSNDLEQTNHATKDTVTSALGNKDDLGQLDRSYLWSTYWSFSLSDVNYLPRYSSSKSSLDFNFLPFSSSHPCPSSIEQKTGWCWWMCWTFWWSTDKKQSQPHESFSSL